MIKRSHLQLVVAFVAAVLFVDQTKASAHQACQVDTDCPGTTCGGDVCDWNMGMTCQTAGKAAKGSDGWCNVDDDCKCLGLGAKCAGFFCTFTTPPSSGGGAGGKAAGTGGATGTGGTAAGTGGTASSTGGASSGSGGAATSDAGATGGAKATDSGGGCSLAGQATFGWAGSTFVLLGLALSARKRRTRR